jgi:hypothetical protein
MDNKHVFFLDLTCWVLIPIRSSVDLTVLISTTSTFFFFCYDKFPLNDRFDHNSYMLMLI